MDINCQNLSTQAKTNKMVPNLCRPCRPWEDLAVSQGFLPTIWPNGLSTTGLQFAHPLEKYERELKTPSENIIISFPLHFYCISIKDIYKKINCNMKGNIHVVNWARLWSLFNIDIFSKDILHWIFKDLVDSQEIFEDECMKHHCIK